MHIANRNNPAKLSLDLFDHLRGAGGDDGDAAEMTRVIHLGHCQTFDVVPAARKQPDHAGQNTGFVLDQNRDRVALLHVRKRGA